MAIDGLNSVGSDLRKHIVIVPGIGGHPAFHRGIADTVARYGQLCIRTHGDFAGPHYETLAAHGDHWRKIITSLGPGPKLLIGISFGSFVVLDLMRDPPADIAGVILISHWSIGPVERAALRGLAGLPRNLTARLLGWLLFAWSELVADNTTELRRFRTETYDDKRLVSHRLLGRLLCLASYDRALDVALAGVETFLIYGASEWSFRMKRRILIEANRKARIPILLVPGGHSISTRNDAGLSALLALILSKFGFFDETGGKFDQTRPHSG